MPGLSSSRYDPQAENFDAEVAGVVAADADATVIIGFAETAKILGGLIEEGFGPADRPVYGTDGNMGNGTAELMGDRTVIAGMKGVYPGVDVAGQLEKLESMLLRGTLTPDEFERQKQRLLGR